MRWLAALVALITAAAAPAQTTVPDPENILYLDLSTGGRVTVAMRPDKAPMHVARVRTLARQHFYDGTVFHRVIDGFMAQGGDPTATGQGGSKLPNLKPEFNDLPHVRGTLAMARADAEDSANSQFYIMLAPKFTLDGKYTVWGRVTAGMQYVDAIQKGEPPANPSRIVRASIATDKVPPPPPAPAVVVPPPPAPVTTTTRTQTKVETVRKTAPRR